MQIQVPRVGNSEQAQQVDGIGFEDPRLDVQPTSLFMETRFVQRLSHHLAARQEAREPLGRQLDLVGLQLGGEHPGQRADLLGDQEVAAHEPLHRWRIAPVAIAHSPSQLWLHIEAQPLLWPAGGEVQVAAHRPQEVEGLNEGADFTPIKHVEL